MKTKIEQLRSWIAESKRMVFFGGAGVSTESGIPDFRSVDGLYHQKFDYPPENDHQPQLLSEKSGVFLPVLSRKNAPARL